MPNCPPPSADTSNRKITGIMIDTKIYETSIIVQEIHPVWFYFPKLWNQKIMIQNFS
nr:hypothetical protein [Allobaculum sp. JKK-2023]